MYRRNMKRANRFWAALCSIAVLFSLVPFFPVSAEEKGLYSIYPGVSGIGAPAVPTSADHLWSGDYVYFGIYDSKPMKYRVLNPQESSYEGKTMLLDCNEVLFTETKFGKDVEWKSSAIRESLNGDFLNSAFSSIEKQSISNSARKKFPSNSTDKYEYVPLTGEKIFVLDALEVQYKPYGYYSGKRAATRVKDREWTLRSCESSVLASKVCYVRDNSLIEEQSFKEGCGVSPALNVSVSSVLFSSAASTEKPIFSSTAVSSDTSEWKLTICDGTSFPQVTANGNMLSYGQSLSVTAGESLSLTHPNVAGDYNQITAALADNTGNILYYGAINTDSTLVSSVVPIPADLSAGHYTLSIYAEKWNGEKCTDYATSPFTFTIDIKEPCTEHKYDDGIISKPAACTESGEKTYTCESCGFTKVEEIPAVRHQFEEWKTETAATCIADGVEIRQCSVCGTRESRSIPCSGHRPGEEIVSQASCTESGNKVTKCSVCGETIETAEIPALGHNFGEWKVETAATCTADGVETRQCSVCGTEESRSIPHSGHTPGEEIISQASCTESGSKETKCSVCGETIETAEIPALGHNFGKWEIKTAATCIADGVETRQCSVCGTEESRNVSCSGHTPGEEIVSQASCTESGSKETKCSVCGETIETAVIPALGHDWEESWTAGEESHWHSCTRCGASKDVETHTGGAATETELARCAVCGKPYGNLLPHVHHYGIYLSDGNASCTANGTKTAKCDGCGAAITVEEVDSALGHNFGEWEVETAATCIADGVETHQCSVCETQESRSIPHSGHTPGEEIVSQASCTESGSKETKCTVCGETIEKVDIPALGHDWEESWTADEESHWHSCTRCGASNDVETHTGGTATETELARCAVCSKPYGNLLPHVHSCSYWAAKERTCLTAGNLEYWYCSSCKKFFADSLGEQELPSDSIVLLASGHHSFSAYTSDGNATCTADGTKTAKCDYCDAVYTVPDKGSALGHSWKETWETDGENHWRTCANCDAVIDYGVHTGGAASETEPAVCSVCGNMYGDLLEHIHALEPIGAEQPTCTKAGHTAYWRCTSCGQAFTDAEGTVAAVLSDLIVPVLEHEWSEWQYDDTNHWKICALCGDKSEVSAHRMGAWIQDIAAAEGKAGSRHTSCSDCGCTQTAEIPPLGHTHLLTYQPVKAPDCTENGNSAYYLCSCGKMFSDDQAANEITAAEIVLKPLGHAFSDWTVVRQAGTSEKGLEKRVCSRCETAEYRDIPAVLPVAPSVETMADTVGSLKTDSEPAPVSEPAVSVQSGWKNVGKNTAYYQNGEKATGWNRINGKTYFFDEQGRLQTDWMQEDGKWFYLDPDTGEQVFGWQKIGNAWYYLDTHTGIMSESGFRQIDGETYYFYDWGGMAGDFWYLDETSGQWYFFRGSGAMAKSDWVLWKGKWYYQDAAGAMLTHTVTPDGYYVDENGVWVS